MLRVGVRAAQDLAVHQAGQLHVGAVDGAAGDLVDAVVADGPRADDLVMWCAVALFSGAAGDLGTARFCGGGGLLLSGRLIRGHRAISFFLFWQLLSDAAGATVGRPSHHRVSGDGRTTGPSIVTRRAPFGRVGLRRRRCLEPLAVLPLSTGSRMDSQRFRTPFPVFFSHIRPT